MIVSEWQCHRTKIPFLRTARLRKYPMKRGIILFDRIIFYYKSVAGGGYEIGYIVVSLQKEWFLEFKRV